MTALPLVVVEWNDAWIDGNDPANLAEAKATHKPKGIITLGYVLYEDDNGIQLANEYYEDESIYRGRTYIPKGMVRKITPYRLTRPHAKRKSKNDVGGRIADAHDNENPN